MAVPPLSSQISAALDASGMTRAQLAQKLGFKPETHGGNSTVTRWVNGDRAPSLAHLARLARLLNTSFTLEIQGAFARIWPSSQSLHTHDTAVMGASCNDSA